MLRRPGAILLLLAATAAGCATRMAVAPPASAPVPDRRAPQLAAAEDLVHRGCYDCLRDALATYESLIEDPGVGTSARAAAVRTSLLLALRETELGLVRGAYIERARQFLGPAESASPELPGLVEIAEVLASGPTGQGRVAANDSQLAAMVTLVRSQQQWASVLRNLMPQDLTASYLWLALACGPYGTTLPDHETKRAVLGASAELPLMVWKDASSCGITASEPLEAQLALEPRFQEINFPLGLFALSAQPPRQPDLDGADARFRAAYEWRQDWPSLTLAMANLAMTAEDFPRGLEFYTRTLAVSPTDADAMMGTIRALTYSNRHEEAIAAADRLLDTRRNPGEARYWKALNLARVSRDDEAWQEIELAASALANADVPKLAGIIAINRRDLAVARDRLRVALQRRPSDCETGFYLQSVLSEQRDWEGVAQVAADAGACFEREEVTLQQELATVRAAQMAPERRARLVARREQQLAADARMRATVWYNAAAANFNLARTDEARRFAEKVAGDTVFGERARSLLERIK
jgi:tetratricopeptide (TPR) repeat protein